MEDGRMLTVKNKVNSRLSQKLKKDDDAPYHEKSLSFSSTLQDATKSFPTLYVKSLGEPSTSDDLEHSVQSAIISTIELRAYTNTNVTDAFNLINKAGDVMLSMGYSLIAGPEDISDINKIVFARFRRLFGAGDSLY